MALLIVLLLSTTGLTLNLYTSKAAQTELRIAHNDLLAKRALSVAEAGLQHAFRLIADDAADGLTDELGGSGTGGAGSGLANMSASSVVTPSGASSQHRFRAFGGASGDGYFVRVDDNIDEPTGANNPATDVDRRIRVTARGRVGNAERIVQAMFNGALPSVGLFGRVSVTIRTEVDSFNSSIAPYDPANPGTSAEVGSDGNIIQNGSGIRGNATAAGTVTGNTAGITGTITQGAPPRNFPPVAPCSPYSDGTGISGSGITHNTATGDIAVTTSITLAPGTYCFNNFNMSGGNFTVNGSVTIYLTGNGTFKNVNNTTGQAANLRIFSSGASLDIESGAGSHMSIYAPDTDLWFHGSGGHFYGAAIGRTVLLEGGNRFHHDLSLGLGATASQLAGWHEVWN